ncbi:MAG: hypothetical protein DA408_19870 [Bacteroidetes bacterium]|nr:MAG: hypothetical protein C7N36_10435 [Bacteroidota bacterium]PTM08765.1 MAG: hypothetical protein DA408_19870 [Bacteroidota bacterium]
MKNLRKQLLTLMFLSICLSISTQESVTIEFTESYMRSSSKLGYFIHTLKGEVLYHEVFSKKAIKKGTISELKIEYPDSAIITIVSGNLSHSLSPLRNNMKFDQDDLFPYSISNSGGSYRVSFEGVEDDEIKFLPDGLSNSRITEYNNRELRTWYNFLHPLFFPYNYNSDTKEYKLFTYKPRPDFNYNQQIVLENKNIFSSGKFINIELPEGNKYKCDILLFSEEYKYPYLLYQEPLVGQFSLSIPIPEILGIYKIGLVLKNEDYEIYSEFNNIDTFLSQDIERKIVSNFEVDENYINLCDSEIDFFHLFLESSSYDGKDYNWVMNGLNADNCEIIFPEIPKELAELTVLKDAPNYPESAILYAMKIPDEVELHKLDNRSFYDIFWRLSNNVVIQKIHYEW